MISFEEFYTTEWIKHIAESGSIKAQLKLLTWMVGTLLVANMGLIGLLIKVLLKE